MLPAPPACIIFLRSLIQLSTYLPTCSPHVSERGSLTFLQRKGLLYLEDTNQVAYVYNSNNHSLLHNILWKWYKTKGFHSNFNTSNILICAMSYRYYGLFHKGMPTFNMYVEYDGHTAIQERSIMES